MVTLNIFFDGICTHFRNVVPGIPHRVVLPNAQAVHFGLCNVALGPDGHEFNYCLLPHFAYLRAGNVLLHATPLITNGFIRVPVRLRLLNSTDTSLEYLDYEAVPSLNAFVPEYEFSFDVVTGGRAACYLDLFGGTISAITVTPQITRFKAEVHTDGAPVFLVSPLRRAGTPAQGIDDSVVLTVPALGGGGDLYELTLSNREVAIDVHSTCDFLLHYLTAAGGIPRGLLGLTPGMDVPPPLMHFDEVKDRLTKLADSAASEWPEFPSGPGSGHDSPSCSDSRYP